LSFDLHLMMMTWILLYELVVVCADYHHDFLLEMDRNVVIVLNVVDLVTFLHYHFLLLLLLLHQLHNNFYVHLQSNVKFN
jgi:hypothetical protein